MLFWEGGVPVQVRVRVGLVMDPTAKTLGQTGPPSRSPYSSQRGSLVVFRLVVGFKGDTKNQTPLNLVLYGFGLKLVAVGISRRPCRLLQLLWLPVLSLSSGKTTAKTTMRTVKRKVRARPDRQGLPEIRRMKKKNTKGA